MVLDDGTGLVELSLSNDFALRQWKSGFGFDCCSYISGCDCSYQTVMNSVCAQGCT